MQVLSEIFSLLEVKKYKPSNSERKHQAKSVHTNLELPAHSFEK